MLCPNCKRYLIRQSSSRACVAASLVCPERPLSFCRRSFSRSSLLASGGVSEGQPEARPVAACFGEKPAAAEPFSRTLFLRGPRASIDARKISPVSGTAAERGHARRPCSLSRAPGRRPLGRLPRSGSPAGSPEGRQHAARVGGSCPPCAVRPRGETCGPNSAMLRLGRNSPPPYAGGQKVLSPSVGRNIVNYCRRLVQRFASVCVRGNRNDGNGKVAGTSVRRTHNLASDVRAVYLLREAIMSHGCSDASVVSVVSVGWSETCAFS